MKFSYVCWDSFKVQFIGVKVQLLQGGQFVQRALTDRIYIIDLYCMSILNKLTINYLYLDWYLQGVQLSRFLIDSKSPNSPKYL